MAEGKRKRAFSVFFFTLRFFPSSTLRQKRGLSSSRPFHRIWKIFYPNWIPARLSFRVYSKANKKSLFLEILYSRLGFWEIAAATIEDLAIEFALRGQAEKGTVPFFLTRWKKGDCPFFWSARMSERSEFRSRREGLRRKGVKNLNGSEAISQNLFQFLSWERGNFYCIIWGAAFRKRLSRHCS